MRLELQEELIFYKMAKIKPNLCGPRTIKRYLNNPQAGKRQTNKRRPSKSDPYRDVIKDKYKTCSATAIFYFIKELGYEGGISILCDYCHQLKKAQYQQPVIRVETSPGDVSQVDWKEDLVLYTREPYNTP